MNRITKDREQIINKIFVKMMDELGYDVDNKEFLRELLEAMYSELPAPKKKK
jgi:hypothetical protein